MKDTTKEHKQKKSQKRVDRQARRAEKRRQKELAQKFKENKIDKKPAKARLSKKSLPGFLAKNVDAIVKWLKNYETLFSLADDYGIQRLDRLPEEKRNLLVQNYIDVSEFITVLEQIINEEKAKKLEEELKSKHIQLQNEEDQQQLKTDELDEIVEMPNDGQIDYRDEPKWEAIEFTEENPDGIQTSISPQEYFNEVKEYVESLSEFEDNDYKEEDLKQ